MSRFRRFVLPVAAVALLAAGCGGGGGGTASLSNSDVAVVGGEQVTKGDFQSLMARAQKSYAAQKRKFPKPGTREYENLKGQAVNYLVQQAEFEDEAEDMGIHISDEKVDARVKKLVTQVYNGSEKKYEDAKTKSAK